MINETQQATDIMNHQDDKMQPSMTMGLSKTGANINLDAPAQKSIINDEEGASSDRSIKYQEEQQLKKDIQNAKKEYQKNDREQTEPDLEKIKKATENAENIYNQYGEKSKEPEKTQGDYELELRDISINNERLYKELEEAEAWLKHFQKQNVDGMTNNAEAKKEMLEKWETKIQELTKEIAKNINRENEIKNSKDFDNRTDEQKREDQATKRKTEDYIQAGLNPAAVSGFYGGGGGGGGGSKSDNEEEKRKRRKREEAQRRKEQNENAMKIIQMLGGMTGQLGRGAIMAHGYANRYKNLKVSGGGQFPTKNINKPAKAGISGKEPDYIDDIMNSIGNEWSRKKKF